MKFHLPILLLLSLTFSFVFAEDEDSLPELVVKTIKEAKSSKKQVKGVEALIYKLIFFSILTDKKANI